MNHHWNTGLPDFEGVQFSKVIYLRGDGTCPFELLLLLMIYKAVFLAFESRRMPRLKFLKFIFKKTKWQCILVFLRKLFLIFFCKMTYWLNLSEWESWDQNEVDILRSKWADLGIETAAVRLQVQGQRRQSQLGQARCIVCQEELKSRSQLIKVKQEISSWSGKIIPKQNTKWVEIEGNRQLQNSRWIGAILVNLTFIPPPSVCKRPLLGNTYMVHYIQGVENH